MVQRELKITGMHCLDCAHKVKRALVSAPGVHSADVKYVRKIAIVDVDEETPVSELVRAVQEAGYGAEPA